jgi:hypothetical protein
MPVCIKDSLIEGSSGNFCTRREVIGWLSCRSKSLSQWQMILITVKYAFR